jgi:hypothetical protein
MVLAVFIVALVENLIATVALVTMSMIGGNNVSSGNAFRRGMLSSAVFAVFTRALNFGSL